jgi:hypothetical protein
MREPSINRKRKSSVIPAHAGTQSVPQRGYILQPRRYGVSGDYPGYTFFDIAC